ncbi:MAG TPA: PDZ domain-containing protein [Vicinamibacterales bacterium]|nr:PDZ domain-containing protein [Vicinamibacterales bacterium]
MTLTRWGALAGALVLAAGAGAPAPVMAQDRDTLTRAFAIAGRGAHIGIAVEELDDAAAKQMKGVRVDTVSPNGPADKAGIKAGDVITEFDGERVRSTLQFSRLVTETPPGRDVPMVLSRNGQRMNVTVSPEPRTWSDDFGLRMLDVPRAMRVPRPAVPPAPPRPPAAGPEPFDFPGLLRFGGGRRLGVTVEGLDDQLAAYFGVKEGVLVKSVLADSAAQKAGIKAGDVITALNGSKVYDASDLNRALDRIDSSGEFTAEIVRDKKTQAVKGKIEARESRGRVRTRTIL